MLEHFMAFFKYFPEFNNALGAGLIIFARFLGFANTAPVLSRKEVPMLVKACIALLLTVSFVGILKPAAPPPGTSLLLSVFLNTIFGTILGFIANTIFAILSSAGDMINMQMGLSSAMMFDPSMKAQSSILGTFFTLFGTVAYINIGGFYWLFYAFKRSFTVFGIYDTAIPLSHFLSMDYLILITSNVLYVGLQIAAPVLLATLGQDIILGIISKTAPQVNVFQLSFLFKPVLGAAILVMIFPMLLNVINDYFIYFSHIF